MRHAYITGSAGFIGFYLLELLLQEGWSVIGRITVTCVLNSGDCKCSANTKISIPSL
jgi:GDP-D-mannose dehydratase